MELKNHDEVMSLLENTLKHQQGDLARTKKALERLESLLPEDHDVPANIVAAAIHYAAKHGTKNVGINDIVEQFNVVEKFRAGILADAYATSLERGRYVDSKESMGIKG